MFETRCLSDQELAEIQRQRPVVRASLACEGMVLSPDEEAFMTQLDDERVSDEDRIQRVIEFQRAKRATKAVAAAR